MLVCILYGGQTGLIRRYKAAQQALQAAKEKQEDKAIESAQEELNALLLFKSDLGAFLGLYTFLSQIFDYGNTAIEKLNELFGADTTEQDQLVLSIPPAGRWGALSAL